MIDILFVHTNAAGSIYQDLSKKHSAIEPPIWAAMLANSVRYLGNSTAILDCEALRLTHDESVKKISEYKPRIVCFVVYGQQPSASTQNMQGASECSKKLREHDEQIKILFVGGHVSALPRQTLEKENQIDFVCQNEGVYTIRELLKVPQNLLEDDQTLKKVPGLGWRTSDRNVVLNSQKSIVSREKLELDLPGMAWDLLPSLNLYRTAGWHSWSNESEKSPFAALYTSLGCPYRCSFCMINIINKTSDSEYSSSEDSNVFRWWSPNFIIKQFDYLASAGVKNVKIADELFVLNPNHFEKICDLIIERGYDFNIWAYSRVDSCKPHYLDKLKRAGVNWLGLGIENPSQTLRKEIHKDGFKDVKITDLMFQLRNSGINIGGNYIFGLPADTKETMQDTLRFALENKTEMVNFYCAQAYPGSPLYMQAVREGWALPKTYSGYSQHSYDMLNLKNDKLTASEIVEFRDSAWMKYNTDPGYLDLLETKFGKKSRENMEDTCKVTLKRKLLEDPTYESSHYNLGRVPGPRSRLPILSST